MQGNGKEDDDHNDTHHNNDNNNHYDNDTHHNNDNNNDNNNDIYIYPGYRITRIDSYNLKRDIHNESIRWRNAINIQELLINSEQVCDPQDLHSGKVFFHSTDKQGRIIKYFSFFSILYTISLFTCIHLIIHSTI